MTIATMDESLARRSAETELKTALERVAASPERLAAILDARHEPLIAFTADRVIVTANAAAERMFGYGRHELDRQSTDILVPERFRQPNAPPQLATGDLTTVEIPRLSKNGTEAPTTWTFSSIPGMPGPVFLLIVRYPLASRERALEDRFRAVYENALDAIVLMDDDLRLVDVNPAACRLLGAAERLSSERARPTCFRERNVRRIPR